MEEFNRLVRLRRLKIILISIVVAIWVVTMVGCDILSVYDNTATNVEVEGIQEDK